MNSYHNEYIAQTAPEDFAIGGKARISMKAFENMPPMAYPELYESRGQVVTIVDWIEPNSDPGVWEVMTEHGVKLYPLPSELEPV